MIGVEFANVALLLGLYRPPICAVGADRVAGGALIVRDRHPAMTRSCRRSHPCARDRTLRHRGRAQPASRHLAYPRHRAQSGAVGGLGRCACRTAMRSCCKISCHRRGPDALPGWRSWPSWRSSIACSASARISSAGIAASRRAPTAISRRCATVVRHRQRASRSLRCSRSGASARHMVFQRGGGRSVTPSPPSACAAAALEIWEASNAGMERHLARLARESRYARAARLLHVHSR